MDGANGLAATRARFGAALNQQKTRGRYRNYRTNVPSSVKALRKRGAYQKGDERILGDGEFVEEALAQGEDSLERKFHLKARGYDFGKVVDRVAEVTGMGGAKVLSSGKYKKVIAARGILCYWAVQELGMRQNEFSRILRISQPVVSMAVSRGEKLVKDHNLRILID